MKRSFVLACAAALVGAFAVPTASASPPPYLQKTLVDGAAIQGANGLAVDHDGKILVASVWSQQIVAVDPATGKVLQRYGPMVGGTPLGAPDDVAVGPDGSIYYTDIIGGQVGRISTTGQLTKQAVAVFVNPIAFDAAGRLFVGQAFEGDCLYEVDPALVAPPTQILCGSGAPGFPDQLNGFDFGPDGGLYAPRPSLEQIIRIDVETGDVTLVSDQLGDTPSSVEFDADGSLYASLGPGRVVRIDTATGAVTTVATLEFGLDNMAFDAPGHLFVSNSDDGAIYRVHPATGAYRVLVKGGLTMPGGIAVLPSASEGDRIVVTDMWRLLTYSGLTGRLVDVDPNFGAFGIPGVFTASADGDHVILTTWIAGVVEVWDPDANALLGVYGGFGTPVNAIRFGTDIVVAALGPDPIVRVTPGGTWSGIFAGALFVPSGLAARGGDLWVADWASGIVWKIAAGGTFLAAPLPVAFGLAQPEGLAVDRDGSLLVVEAAAGRLTRIDPSTGATTTVADGLGLGAPTYGPPTWMFNGVAVGARGDIYVTGDVANVVYRFSPVP